MEITVFCCFVLSKLNQINEMPAKEFFEFIMREHLYSTHAPVSVLG